MRNFILSVDATCDLDNKTIRENNINVAPMVIMIGDKEIASTSNNSLENVRLCNKLLEGEKVMTSQISPTQAKGYLQNLLKENKDVLHISFTSGMSGTYNNFKMVADELNKENENKVYVVDSLCQAGGISLLVLMLLEEIEKSNLDINGAIKFLEDNKLKIAHLFTVNDLRFLAQGGRISKSSALVGNILNIKPILKVNNEGVIVSTKKLIGRKKAVDDMFKTLLKEYNSLGKYIVVSYSCCEQEALDFAYLIQTKLKVKVVLLSLSSVITCHTGSNTLSVFYTTDKR